LQYHQKAELYNYISTVHKKVEGRYKHAPMTHSLGHGFLEGLLAEKALRRRIKDSFYAKNYKKEKIYINYEISNAAYAALAIDKNTVRIGVKEKENTYRNKIRINAVKIGAHT